MAARLDPIEKARRARSKLKRSHYAQASMSMNLGEWGFGEKPESSLIEKPACVPESMLKNMKGDSVE